MTVDEKTARRVELGAACCLLLKVCLSLIHGVHDLQYTAMVTINKVIDAAVVHSLGHVRVRTSTALHHPCNDRSVAAHPTYVLRPKRVAQWPRSLTIKSNKHSVVLTTFIYKYPS